MKTTLDANASINQPPGRSRHALVTFAGGLRVHPLPESGDVLIGRAGDCHIVLDHAKVSRQHARLRMGERSIVEDLGSRNGTTFRGRRLEPGEQREVPAGDSFSVGPFSVLLLPPGAAPPPSPQGVGPSLRIDDPSAPVPSALLTAVARAQASVIILGETGVGKEVLAASLHRLSGRKGPFLGVNCAALSETLLESELFGHERGAFTGAAQRKPGLLETAAEGTVLLDEVGDMPPSLQAKLLRAIEAREVFRVGGVKPVAIDVRFLAAAHKNLLAHDSAGGFRRDLYYRLAGVTLEIPPLRQRKDRIASLAVEILAQAAARASLSPPALAPAAMEALAAHDWPGNVREMRNVVERALLLSSGGAIGREHIIFDSVSEPAPPPSRPDAVSPSEAAERHRLLAALEACAGNQTRAAEYLGVSRATLVNKLAIHRIPRPRKRD